MSTDNPFASFQPKGGDLLQRLPGDSGHGDDSPYNWALMCGECKNVLGPLGVFPEHTVKDVKHRRAHCTVCHATSVVIGRDVHLSKPSVMGGVCTLGCGSPVVDRAPKIVLA